MLMLGIETSCDETAAAVVDGGRAIRANIVLSQLDQHRAFGGVVPEIAARAHLDHIDTVIRAAMDDAGIGFGDLSGVASTCGPGLIGGVMIGMMAGKAIAAARGKPFVAVNHLEAHALTPRLTGDIDFPYLLLLVSGGHTQTLVVEGVGRYRRLGGTIDDALGECFDKAAKLMGLPYPGGPNLELAAARCADPARAAARFPLPLPLRHRKEPDFSFSGLKTAMRTHVGNLPEGGLRMQDVADLASAFQDAVAEILRERCAKAVAMFLQDYRPVQPTLVVAGGVAANRRVRQSLEALAQASGMRFAAPPLKLCGDNGAMVAWAGIERLRLGMTDGLDFKARPRWPLGRSARCGLNV